MADITGKQVTVFGGSGFVGRHLIRRLAADGHVVRVAVRDPERALYLKVMGKVGHIVPIATDIADPAMVARAVAGADWVVNLVGTFAPGGRYGMERIHVGGAANVAEACRDAGITRLAHMSALGATRDAPALYGRSKAAGEDKVRAAFPGATILRPSVVFGPEDNLFNMFACIARYSPVLPVLGANSWNDGGAKFQPVYVGDVADAVMAALARDDAVGKTFELGGPAVMDARQIMQLVLDATGRRRLLVPAPYWLLSLEAFFLEWLPGRLLTRDQVKMLRVPNVVSGSHTIASLGIEPTAVGAIAPDYLSRFRRPGRRRFGPATTP